MHEFSIMQEVAEMAVTRAEEAGADKIHLIRLRVGKLSGVVPEAMRFVHEVAVEGTIAEGATLEIEDGPIICSCDTCETDFESGNALFLCPKSETVSHEVRSGRELELLNMEIS